MDIQYQYTKLRCNFGRQPLFCEQGPEMCDSIQPHPAEYKNYILRNPVHQQTQNTADFSECHVNTIRAEYATSGANHAEGGWPKDVNILDPEATQRYRRKIEKDDNYIHCVMTASAGLEHYSLQNNAVALYQTYYAEMPHLPEIERNSCRTVNLFRDVNADGSKSFRPVNSISWQSDKGQRFAATYVDNDFYGNPRSHTDCYIWNFENANSPEITLTPPCCLFDLQFSPREKTVLAGGLLDGRVACWDSRQNGSPISMCPPHVSHRDLVCKVLFINTKSGQEFFSGGPDGMCKWWDMRNMREPTDEMIIDTVKTSFDVQSMVNAHGISTMEYEPTIPTRFMVGTEDGLVIGGNRKGKTPMEMLPAKIETHLGPVKSLRRNPGFLKNFLTVGDWTARVWSEDCKESAILWSPPQRHKITAGVWSPTRLSVMLLTQWNGVLGVWDLLRRQHETVLSVQVCREPLLQLEMHENGQLLICGSQRGGVYLVELSQHLAETDKQDKALLTAIFERESKREKILEARLREIRLKMRQAEEASPAASASDLDPTLGDRDLAEATADFTQLVKKEVAAM